MDPKKFLESDENLRAFVEGPLYEQHSEALRKKLQKKNTKLGKYDKMHSKYGRNCNFEKAQESYQKWLRQKSKERRQAREKQAAQAQLKITEKQINADQAKREFKKWLEKKRKLEAKERAKQKVIESADKEKPNKQLDEVKCGLVEQMSELNIIHEKETSKEPKKLIFGSWIKNLKNKPVPVSARRSFDILRTSGTVPYIGSISELPDMDLQPNE